MDLIVPMADKVLGQDQSPRPRTREMLMTHLRTQFLNMLLFLVTMKMMIMAIIILLLLRGKEVKLQPQFPWIFFMISWESWMRDFLFQDQRFIKCLPAGKSMSGLIKMAVPVKLLSQFSSGVNQMVCHLMKNLLIVQRRLEGMIIA